MNILDKSKIYVGFVSCLAVMLFFLPHQVDAAQLVLTSPSSRLPVGQTVQIDVHINTQDEAVNALSATLHFPSKLLDFVGTRDGSSVFTFWVEPAHLSTNDSVSFSGVTPGGFSIDNGSVITLLFKAKSEGEVAMKLDSIELLKNDGAGTAIPVGESVLPITIDNTATSTEVVQPVDVTPPQEFTITLSHDKNFSQNQWFIAFAAQDKESGIHHYEVAERRGALIDVAPNDKRLEWREAVSPYVLHDQSLKSGIYVRAIDRAGNDRVSRLAPGVALVWYENYYFWGILFSILVVVGILGSILWRFKVRKK